MSKTIISGCLYLIIALSVNSKAEEWQGIKPLYSTRADVERLLGKPDKPGGRFYKLKNENVFIIYSDGKCDSPDDWSVPKDIVLSIEVLFRPRSLLLSDLKIDKTKFKITQDVMPNSLYYRNEEEGITYHVVSGEYVDEIYYYPSAKDNHLRCSANATSLRIEELRRIKPLNSTRASVEDILGQPTKSNGTIYILNNVTVEVIYSDGMCSGSCDWNVPKDTVINIKIIPKDLMLFSNLKLDGTKFKKLFDVIPTGFYYRNEEDGITYEVNYGAEIPNIIDAIYFHPRVKDNYLRCSFTT